MTTAPAKAPELVYFLSVEGRAQVRYGSDQFIGCRRDRETEKLVWSPEPVPIGKAEHARFLRDYNNCVRRGDLQALKAETLEGGAMRFTVLPGGPAPTAKNKLKPAGEMFVVGANGAVAASPTAPAAPAAPPEQAPAPSAAKRP